MAGANFLRSDEAEFAQASALSQMAEKRRRRIFDFPKDGIEQQSDIDVDYWTRDLPEPSKAKALLHAAFGAMRKDVMGGWSKSISSDIADSEKDVFQEFMRSRIDDPSGHRSEREAMQEHYITKMLGFNSTMPSAHRATRYTQTGPGEDGRIRKRDVVSRGDENKYGEWYYPTPEFSAASKLEGEDALVQRRMVGEYMERPEYFEDLWKSALKTNSFEEIATGTSGINSIAGRELRKMLDALNAIPQDPRAGEAGWGGHVDDLMMLRNAIMDARPGGTRMNDGGIDTGNSSQYTDQQIKDLEEQSRLDAGMSTSTPAPEREMTNEERTLRNEDFGRGAIPAAFDMIGSGLNAAKLGMIDKVQQIPRAVRESISEGAEKMRTQEYKDRQTTFGTSTSPAFRRESLAKWGPPEDRPAPAFLRGVGQFLFGGDPGRSATAQNETAPSNIDFSVVDTALLANYDPMEVASMTQQQKLEAYEEHRGFQPQEMPVASSGGRPRLSRSARGAPGRAIRSGMEAVGDVASATAGGVAAKLNSPFRTLKNSMSEGMATMRTQEYKDRQPPFGGGPSVARERELTEQYGPKEGRAMRLLKAAYNSSSFKAGLKKIGSRGWKDRQPRFGSATSVAHERDLLKRFGPAEGRSLRKFQANLKRFNEMLGGESTKAAEIEFGEIDAILLTQYFASEVSEMTDEEKVAAYMRIEQ